MDPIHHIIAATDFSEQSHDAIAVAVDLARRLDADLTLVHVWQITPLVAIGAEYATGELVGPLLDAAKEQLDDEVAQWKETYPRVSGDLRTGVAWDQVIDAAREQKAGLIVMGTHGRTGVRRALLGSVAEKVVRLAPVPVLTVPHKDSRAAPEMVKSA